MLLESIEPLILPVTASGSSDHLLTFVFSSQTNFSRRHCVKDPCLLPCRLSNLLCFRHPFSAEEETLHHQYQKQNSRTSMTNRKIKKKNKLGFCELVLKHGYGDLPYGAFTD